MKLRISFFGLFLFLCILSMAQANLDWRGKFGGDLDDGGGNTIIGSSGKLYTVATYSINSKYTLNNKSPSDTLPSFGKADMCVLRHDSNGNLDWAMAFGGNSYDQVIAIDLDSQENMYIVGMYYDTCDFDPSPDSLTQIGSDSHFTGFIAKYDSAQNVIWVKSIKSTWSNVYIYDVRLDPKGNIYVCGFLSNETDLDPGPDSMIFHSSKYYGFFVEKLSNDGNLIWAKTWETNQGGLHNIELDDSGYVYCMGIFNDSLDVDPDSSIVDWRITHSTGSQNYDGLILKLDSNGNYINDYIVEGRGNDGTPILKFGEQCLYIAGTFADTVDLDFSDTGKHYITTPGQLSCYIARYNHNFELIWTKALTGNQLAMFTDMEVMEEDEVIFALFFYGYIQIPTYQTFVDSGFYDGLYGRIDSSGVVGFVHQLTNHTTVIQSRSYVHDVTVNKKNVYLNGFFNFTVDFAPQPYITESLSTGGTNADLFFVKYNLCYKDTVYRIDMCDSLISPGNNFVVYSPGKYIDTAFSGCGGTIHYFETYRKSTSSQINEVACKAYTSPSGKIFTKSGIYLDTLTSATYCGYDSIIRIALTMKPSYTETVNLTACDSFIAGGTGQTWYSSGIYKDTIDVETAVYCDTIKTYNLSIHQTDQVKIVESCEQFISPSGKTWTSTSTYYDTMINPLGCIDHFTFHLTIHPKEITTIDTSACDQMFSPSGKQLWTTSGSFYDTLKSVNACDSILNINLTIDKSIRVDIYDSACNAYILPSTIQVDSSGIFKDTLASVSGCDSINSYHITIYQPTFTSLTVQSCGPYQLPSDRMVETSGIYVDTMVGAQGCDSVIQIQLTQLKPEMTVNRFGDSLKAYGSASNYLWLNCTNNFQIIPGARDSFFIPSIAGNYAVRGYDGNCADTSECFNFIIAHIKSFDNIDIKVYPNPSDGLIKWDFPTESRWEVLLTDSRGRVIYKGETSKKQVRFNNLSSGMYFLTLSCQNLVSHIPVFFKD